MQDPNLYLTIEEAALNRDMRWLAQLARRLTSDASLAKDACQEVWSSWDFAKERPGPTRSFLARALRQALWLNRRSEQRRRDRESTTAKSDISPLASPEELVSRLEERQRAWGALVELQEPYRSTLLLRFDEDLPPSQIAERLGVSANTVRWRIRRGIELLRAVLGVELPSSSRWGVLAIPLAWFEGLRSRLDASTATSTTVTKTSAFGLPITLKSAAATCLVLVGALALGWHLIQPANQRPGINVAGQMPPTGNAPSEAPGARAGGNGHRQEGAERITAREPVTQPSVRRMVVGSVVQLNIDGVESPLPNARIIVSVKGATALERRSSSNGSFQIEVPDGWGATQELLLGIEAGSLRTRVAMFVGPNRHTVFRAGDTVLDVGRIQLKPAAVLVGTCVDEAGRPVEGARLDVDEKRWIVAPELDGTWRSDNQGEFRIPHVPLTSTSIHAARAPHFDAERILRLGEPGLVDVGDLVFRRSTLIRGVVTDAAGVVMGGVQVTTRDFSDGWTAVSWPDGSFELPAPRPFDVRVKIRAPGYEQQGRIAQAVAGGEPITVVLESVGQRCAIMVISSASGLPIENVGLEVLRGIAEPVDADAFEFFSARRADPSLAVGQHVFHAHQGKDSFMVSAPGYVPKALPVSERSVVDEGGSTTPPPIPWGLGQRVALDPLPRGISGIVVDSRDEPLAGVEVQLVRTAFADLGDPDRSSPVTFLDGASGSRDFDPFSSEIASRTRTDERGAFAFDVPLGATPYYVVARDGHLVARSRGIDATNPFGDVGRLCLELGATLQGELVLPNGAKRGRHRIWAGARQARTEGDGIFRLEGLAPGEHLLLVEPDPQQFWVEEHGPQAFFVRVASGDERHVSLEVTGRVLSSAQVTVSLNGSPIREAWLVAQAIDGAPGAWEVLLDDQGRGTLRCPQHVRLTFTAEVDGARRRRVFLGVSELASSQPVKLAFEAFDLEVLTDPEVSKTGDALTLTFTTSGELESIRGLLVESNGARSKYSFETIPTIGREFQLQQQPVSGVDWKRTLTREDLAGVRAGGTCVIDLRR